MSYCKNLTVSCPVCVVIRHTAETRFSSILPLRCHLSNSMNLTVICPALLCHLSYYSKLTVICTAPVLPSILLQESDCHLSCPCVAICLSTGMTVICPARCCQQSYCRNLTVICPALCFHLSYYKNLTVICPARCCSLSYCRNLTVICLASGCHLSCPGVAICPTTGMIVICPARCCHLSYSVLPLALLRGPACLCLLSILQRESDNPLSCFV